MALALALGTLILYWPVTKFQFLNFDDTDFVTTNPRVQAGLTWDSFKWAWHSEVARNWHPITMLTHMLDCQIYKLNAGGHHFTNVLIHTANVVLLFYILTTLTGAVWRCAFVAGLFAWHPLHVESVAWIAERKDVLSTLFWFLTILAYAVYVQVGRAKLPLCPNPKANKGAKQQLCPASEKIYYSLTLLFLALGLMSKPMLVTMPFFLLILDFWPLGRIGIFQSTPVKGHKVKTKVPPFPASLIWEKIPLLVMSIILCVITYLIQQHGGAVVTEHDRPLGTRVENALISYVRYIGKMCWPSNLAGLYLHRGGWPLYWVILAAIALLVVSIIAVMQAGRRPWLAAGWFWYLGTLVPVIGLVQVGMQSMADRFTYVPLIGLFIIISWGGCELAQSWRIPEIAVRLTAIAILVTCLGLTAHQLTYWKDSETFFTRMTNVTEDNYMAHYNLGNLYTRQKKFDEAEANYKAAINEEPNYADAENNYSGLLLDEKRYDEAMQHCLAAIRIRPDFLFYLNYANTVADAASARHDANLFAAAESAYQQALQINPNSSKAHDNFGMTLDAEGKEAEAANEFRQVVRLEPDFELAHFNLANALFHSGKSDDAIPEYRTAIQLNPDRAESYDALGMCFAMKNQMPDAEREFRAVIQLQPGNASGYGNLANAFAAQNRLDDAIPNYLTALRLNPNDFQTEFNLGLTLSRQGKVADAENHYRQALRIKPDYTQAQQALQQLENGGKN